MAAGRSSGWRNLGEASVAIEKEKKKKKKRLRMDEES